MLIIMLLVALIVTLGIVLAYVLYDDHRHCVDHGYKLECLL